MILDNIKAELEKHDLLYRGICHDCGTHVEVSIVVNEKDEIEITGGAIYKIKQGFGEEVLFFKCDECHKKERTLRNWKQCEVYSRVVGYLRPVQQWNKGKEEEYKMRKEFVVPERQK
jgi:hypothetical protein